MHPFSDEIWITGAGIVSALGIGKDATRCALLQQRSGVGPLRYLKTEHHEFPVGEVPLSDEEMMCQLGIPSETPTTRTSLMGMMALQEALIEARLGSEQLQDVPLVSGTTVGGMDMSEQYYLDFLENDSRNVYIKTHDCGACSEMIADHFGRFSMITTLSTACSSAANAVILGANLIRSGQAHTVVVGGSECITKFHLNGFNSLMILDTQPCRPFDASRAGLNLGEGAAFLVLERSDHAVNRGQQALCRLAGYGNACDAFHQTASSPDGEGAFRAMLQALRMGGITPAQVDYVNAHGTGTPNNDASESKAMKRLFGEQLPPVSSTKAFTGHTTSASGAIEAVICLLSMQYSFLPANLNHSGKADEECVMPNLTTRVGVQLDYVLCNSFGFGGNDSSLLLAAQQQAHHKMPHPKSHIYVLSAKQISSQEPLTEKGLTAPRLYEEHYCRAQDPDFKPYVSPIEGRRMGKILKRAIATSQEALKASGLAEVDAVVTGTGLGCIENTELFLTALCKEGEHALKPTHFMQSTHNTISSLIAIQLKNHGYNATYAHKGVSFESALLDAFTQLRLGMIHSALVGGHDELTPTYYELLKKADYLGMGEQLACECAVSTVLSTAVPEGKRALCELLDIRMLYCPTSEEFQQTLAEMAQSIAPHKADFLIRGCNGNPDNDRGYDYLVPASVFSENLRCFDYRKFYGESYSASALGFYAGCYATDMAPYLFVLNRTPDGKDYSVILLKK